jgi:tetratricopeptide (TPR) repeat protein
MKTRLRNSGLLLTVLAAFAASPVPAQSGKTGERVMISTLKSTEKQLGVQAAEAIRSQLSKQTNVRDLVVVPRSDIETGLMPPEFRADEPMASGDAKAMASLVRAREFLEATVTKTLTGYKIDSRLVISRDMTRGQVLPTAYAPKLDDAASQVARSIVAARKQLDGETACHNAVAQGKYQRGVNAARSAMAGYPNANIAAACLVDAYAGLKMDDSVIAVSERIRANDPVNTFALRRLNDAYRTRSDTGRQLDILNAWAVADPTNIKLVQDVVDEMAKLGHADRAVPLLRDLIRNNPGDPALLNLGLLVYLNAKEYKDAVAAGEEMVRVDTAQATADFFGRMASAYIAMGQPQKAAETAGRGIAKFPNDPNLLLFNAQALFQAGQLQQAVDAAKKAIAANPKNPQAYFLLATVQDSLNLYDDLATTLHNAWKNGVDPASLAPLALKQGNHGYKISELPKDRADLQRAIKFLQLSDTLQSSVDAKFLLGATAFSLGQSAVNDAKEKKSCELARMARDAFNLASINLPAGGQKYPAEAAQLMNAIPQFMPTVESEVKRFCKLPTEHRRGPQCKKDPIAVAGAALKAIAISQTAYDSELNAIVQHAWRIGDKKALFEKAIAPYLDDPGLDSWWVRAALESFPVADLGLDYLLEWVATSPEVRAPTLARLIGPPVGAFRRTLSDGDDMNPTSR